MIRFIKRMDVMVYTRDKMPGKELSSLVKAGRVKWGIHRFNGVCGCSRIYICAAKLLRLLLARRLVGVDFLLQSFVFRFGCWIVVVQYKGHIYF